MIGGWDKPEVAKAQHDLVLKELSAPETCGPYAAFRWAMDKIRQKYFSEFDYIKLLDIGCGVGHYGVLCERFYPGIRYHGTDVSEAMIEQAQILAPLGLFSVCEFSDNKFGDYDIILTGQTLEITDDPRAALGLMLRNARQYIIYNRIRTTDKSSCRINEGTYCGNVGRTWLWNVAELMRFIEERATILTRKDWDNQVTLVIKARNDKSAELCSCACSEVDA